MKETLFFGYHYVRDGKAPGPNCTPARLRSQLEWLKKEGWEVLNCRQIAKSLKTNQPLPERLACLSFDDGLADQFTTAFPILKECGVPATFFVTTCVLDGEVPPVIGFQILIEKLGAARLEKEILPELLAGTSYATLLDETRYEIRDAKFGEPEEMRLIKWVFNHFPSQSFKRDILVEIFDRFLGAGSQAAIAANWFMNEEQLLKMAKAGMEIASHTVTHPPFDVSGLSDIETELAESKKQLSFLGPIETFGWPFGGKFRPKVMQAVARHYSNAWNFLSTLPMPPPPYDLYDIPRLNENCFNPVP